MKKYLVAYAEGGPRKQNQIRYSQCQLIEANTPIEAMEKYEIENHCKGNILIDCLGEYDENSGKVAVPLSVFIDE